MSDEIQVIIPLSIFKGVKDFTPKGIADFLDKMVAENSEVKTLRDKVASLQGVIGGYYTALHNLLENSSNEFEKARGLRELEKELLITARGIEGYCNDK